MNFELFRLNYQLKEVLGHGSQSTVRRVIRRDTQQTFAAKIYQSSTVKAKHQIDMLVRLDHPSIVNIYEVYQEDSCIILILDFMAGGELYDQLSQRKRLTEPEVRSSFTDSETTLGYSLMQQGVIHRDIKPENLLLTTNGPDGLLKLSDFGISRIFSDDQLLTICGTPIYMAPELWRMEPYNEKVDIWSIGVVAYYLLSGQYPFSGDNTQQLQKSVCLSQLAFKEKVWDSVSGRALIFLKQALNKDKKYRSSAADLLQSIWFVQPMIKTVQVLDPNLSEAIISISRQKIKTKKIRKQKELREIIRCSLLPQVRFQFLTYKDQQTRQPSDVQQQNNSLI